MEMGNMKRKQIKRHLAKIGFVFEEIVGEKR
jgi:hypothetical protein